MAKSFALEETTIDQIHDAYRAKTLTCVELVQGYLDRIAAYDQKGPALNAFVALNADALTEAAALDAAFQQSGKLSGPLHGIPIAVKDQAETKGIPTSFGSIAIKGYVPKEDSTLVAKLKAAGAVILGKTTLPDFATSWFGYSSASGETKNPYDLARDPGGSSAGTGAAIAANLAAVGIGEEPPTREELNNGRWTVLTFPTNTLIAAQTWLPSICLPAGFSSAGIPVGLEMVVLPYHEPDLFRLGYAFEQATHHRRPPAAAPPL